MKNCRNYSNKSDVFRALRKTFHVNFWSAIIFLVLFVGAANAQKYPFTLPNNIKATLNVETGTKEKFKNRLLSYNIDYFDTKKGKDFFRTVEPIGVRFPIGVWSNFYNWKTDKFQKDSYNNGQHEEALKRDIREGEEAGITGLTDLYRERKNTTGKGFDIMWTYSMNFDDAASNVARVKKDRKNGLEVKDIELGNEHFWSNQRSNQTKTPQAYRNRAKSVAKALHKEFPDIRVSIPLSWRRNHRNYNKTIADDKQYFDAVSLHLYTGADPDKPGQSNTAYTKLLTSRLNLQSHANWIRSNFAPGKPIWLTEWGVSAGNNVHAAACLGMADTYLYMSENQHVYDRANWFIFNKKLNAMVELQANAPSFPIKKRGYLSTYEVLQDILKDATMLKSSMTTTKLKTKEGQINAVSARVVTKNGKTTAIVVNLTNKPVVFVLKFNGTDYKGNFKHEALVFNNLGVVKSIPYTTNPLQLIKNGSGAVTLPPLSISKLSNLNINTGNQNINPTVSFKKPTGNPTVKEGYFLMVEADASDADGSISGVQLFIDNKLIREEKLAPYEWGHDDFVNELRGLKEGKHTFKVTATDNKGAKASDSFTLTVQKKGDPDPDPNPSNCNFGTPLSKGISAKDKVVYNKVYIVGNGGPKLSNFRKFTINWVPGNNGLYQFAINTNNGSPDWYVDFKNTMTFQLKNARPEVTLNNTGFAGLDGSYWVAETSNSLILVSKTKGYSIHFSNAVNKPACSNKINDDAIGATFVKVAKNPFGDQLVLTNVGADAFLAVLFDYSGKKIIQFPLPDKTEEFTLETSELSKGLYFVKIVSDGQDTQTLKVIKE